MTDARIRHIRRRARHHGFTLIEMLLVFAVITVLAAIVVPLAARVLAMARGVHCQNNLRELGKCLRLYYDDHGGVFPPMQAAGGNEELLEQMADEAGLTVSGGRLAGGYHWSIILWPYHRDLRLYTCPSDPDRDRRTDARLGSPFADAPPESYSLNTLLFRSMPKLRERAGASWGLRAGQFQSPLVFTTLNDQRRTIPRLDSRILLCCGSSGFPVGHASNVVWRDSGQGPDNRRSEWHPWPGPEPFEDGEGFGSYYLFFSGAAEYREQFPTRFEWALDLK